MYERCPSCKNRTGFTAEQPPANPRCPSCGHVFTVEELDIPSPDPELVVVGARGEAASAGGGTARSRGAGSWDGDIAGTIPGTSVLYDPGFREAVEAGHLTTRQAAERGDRMRWASRLVDRHQLTMDQALLVTDNKKTLAEVIGRPRADRPSRAVALFGILLVVAAVAGGVIWRAQKARSAGDVVPVTPGASETNVLVNETGQVTAVTAPDAEAVLALFCRSTSAVDKRDPVRVVSTQTDWLGIFREAGRDYSIRIRKDSTTGQFTAGDGSGAIQPQPAAALPGTN